MVNTLKKYPDCEDKSKIIIKSIKIKFYFAAFSNLRISCRIENGISGVNDYIFLWWIHDRSENFATVPHETNQQF